MPLDGHSYLVAQGWSGKGTGLRQGAITRPITVSQKKTLSGIGKDRDEAFPFWDHLFSAAAKSIQVKITSSDEEEDSDEDTPSAPTLKRTTTGILSNKRPIDGIPATPDPSGSSTPISSTAPIQRLSLLSMAKREAAKRGLYSKFFRGPVLGPDPSVTLPSPSPTPAPSIPIPSIDKSEPKKSDKGKGKTKEEKALKRQRRAEKAERRERRRLKLEARTAESDAESEKVARKRKRKTKEETRSAEKCETSSAAYAGVKKKKRHRKVEVTDEATDEPPRKKKRKREHTE
ncbi:hypothetical protein BDZ89DRAFT_1020975 [Hymenopellis radicata]|nr:hypothetical protein BDZ89DRAFT_1020975 [Hymenopellis radicata]